MFQGEAFPNVFQIRIEPSQGWLYNGRVRQLLCRSEEDSQPEAESERSPDWANPASHEVPAYAAGSSRTPGKTSGGAEDSRGVRTSGPFANEFEGHGKDPERSQWYDATGKAVWLWREEWKYHGTRKTDSTGICEVRHKKVQKNYTNRNFHGEGVL